VFIVICLLLVVVVLLQKGRGGGLGAAFGGGGGGAFGARTGDVFTWVTVVLTGVFLLLAVGTSLLFQKETGKVLAPVFLPASRPIDKETTVTITCATEGATIRWTLDGSDPTDKSDVYEGRLKVHPDMTVKARAFRPGWTISEVVTAEYPRIKAPATVSATAPALPVTN